MLIKNESDALAETVYNYSRPPELSPDRLKNLQHRVIDEHSKGVSLGIFADAACVDVERFEIWLNAPDSMPWFGRTAGEKSAPELIADKLDAYFSDRDKNGLNLRDRCPVSVETSVTRAIIYAVNTARIMCEPVLIDAPSGLGKTESIRQYMVNAKKTEGFDCPVWRIVISESTATVTAVLRLLAREIVGHEPYGKNSDAAVSQSILDATRGRDGVLVIDEAQHLGDASKINGIRIFNELRTLNDSGNFGMALFGNKEIYNLLKKKDYTQISSRAKSFRVEIAGLEKWPRNFEQRDKWELLA